MNAERGFELHPGAASDITSIWEFITKDNPLAAKRVREDILDAIRRLVPFPHQGHQRRDLTSRPVRFQTVHNYLIAYAPDEEPLLVLAVLDGRRSHACSRPSFVDGNESPSRVKAKIASLHLPQGILTIRSGKLK